MIGEQIDLSNINSLSAKHLVESLENWGYPNKNVLLIAGESGSGKTHMATAIQQEFKHAGISAELLHMDDFFHLPPASNHQNRLLDITNVGPQEVNLTKLNSLIFEFKQGARELVHPLVHYYENKIETNTLDVSNAQVLIIEGTYAFFIDQGDFHLFMSRNYIETRVFREKRNRGDEVNDAFVEQVLKIEHQIISSSKNKANAIIDIDFKLVKNDN